jgi:hypothetical protein
MNAPTLSEIEDCYLNLTLEERLEFNKALEYTEYCGWKHLEAKLLAQYWIKYGYLARKIQEKELISTSDSKNGRSFG